MVKVLATANNGVLATEKMRKQQKNKKSLLTSHLDVFISRVVTDELPTLFVRGGMVAGGRDAPAFSANFLCEVTMAKTSDETVQKLVELSATIIAEYAANPNFKRVSLDGSEIDENGENVPLCTVEPINVHGVNRPNRYQSRDALYERRANFDTLFPLCFEATEDRDAYITRADIRAATDAAMSISGDARRIYVQEELGSKNSRGYRSWVAYIVGRAAYAVQIGQSDVLYGLKVKSK